MLSLKAAASDDLDDSSDAMADFLVANRVFGERGDAATCPLALYVREQLPGSPAVLVDRFGVSAYWPGCGRARVPLSGALSAFIDDFDDHRFPQLVVGPWYRHPLRWLRGFLR